MKVPEGFVYNAKTLAVPREVIQDNYNKIFDGRLHPKRKSHSIRREMTERRITENIRQYNSTNIQANMSDLWVGSIREPQESTMANPLHHES